MLHPRGTPKSQAFRRFRHGSQKLDRGQALPPNPPAIAQYGLATLARVAIQKTMLPFPANLRRLILSLHKFSSVLTRDSVSQSR
jgi:hypothetical protein